MCKLAMTAKMLSIMRIIVSQGESSPTNVIEDGAKHIRTVHDNIMVTFRSYKPTRNGMMYSIVQNAVPLRRNSGEKNNGDALALNKMIEMAKRPVNETVTSG